MIYLLFLIIIFIFELKRKKPNDKFDLLTGINGFYAIYFGLSPFLISYLDLRDYIPYWALPRQVQAYYGFKDTLSYLNPFIFILISYIFIIFGYYLLNKYKVKNKYVYKEVYIHDSKILNLGMVSFIVSFFSLAYYTYSLNGIREAILLAEYTRSINSNFQDSFMFLRLFQPFIICSFYCFLLLKYRMTSKVNSEGKMRNLFTMFMFVLTLILSFYYLLITASRSQILIFIIVILLFRNKKIKIRQSITVGLLIIIGFIYGDSILTYLQTGQYTADRSIENSMQVNLSKFVVQTIYPFINITMVPSFISNISDFRFFGDFIFIWIINMLPGGLLGLFGIGEIKPLWAVNTNNFNSITGGIPVDLISSGYYQLGIIGIILLSFTFGLIIKRLDDFFKRYNNDAIKLLKIRFLFFIPTFVINADPEAIVRSGLNIIIMFAVFYYAIRKPKNNGK
ncbi:O-antigen polymerase [Cytobacillus gottheilii]|uniref:O-antigen polymerase n=1 Tax=Cytobacillus gottheilii TaxID=859144 RepID=UPI0024943D22|nr:O-antigen polymerase [Cytobacillus gottheilii]